MKKVRTSTRLLFILPAVIWFSVIVILPVLVSVYYSFFDWNGITEKVFVGLRNYREMLKDEIVWNALKNSLKMAFWCVILQLPIGMFFAIMLCNVFSSRRTFFFFNRNLVVPDL